MNSIDMIKDAAIGATRDLGINIDLVKYKRIGESGPSKYASSVDEVRRSLTAEGYTCVAETEMINTTYLKMISPDNLTCEYMISRKV